MPPQLPPPPPRPVLFDVDDRPSSPTACEDQLPVACEGLELTVYGLNRDTSRSAVTHLRQVLHDLKQSLDRDPARDALYDAVVVRAADTRQAVDYAYVSLSLAGIWVGRGLLMPIVEYSDVLVDGWELPWYWDWKRVDSQDKEVKSSNKKLKNCPGTASGWMLEAVQRGSVLVIM
ncbi:hypothetical protein LXA43DRAFT_1104228 [Ganoderma leucocontextum]|nr:hypothetical protein LXA43DRAFT_1104228 [Ganoderma leucocontextum]